MMTRSTLRRFQWLAAIVAISALMGGAFSLTQHRGITIGISVGASMSGALGTLELILIPLIIGRTLSRLPFALALLVRTLIYGAVIMAALLLVPWVVIGGRPRLDDPSLPLSIGFSVGASLTINFCVSVTQLVGARLLGNFLTGRYYRPREGQLILMFLDLASSTSTAERLGNVRFHMLLSDVFTRLSEVVTNSGGDVYEYVGDEMVATWPIRSTGQNAQVLTCFFECTDAVEAARGTFEQRYGCVPRFRAGLHLGTVVVGEIGGFKREIAYTGDAMNTTARIEGICREMHEPLLASKPLMDAVALPPDLEAISIGTHALRGKEANPELFAIRRACRPDRARRPPSP